MESVACCSTRGPKAMAGFPAKITLRQLSGNACTSITLLEDISNQRRTLVKGQSDQRLASRCTSCIGPVKPHPFALRLCKAAHPAKLPRNSSTVQKSGVPLMSKDFNLGNGHLLSIGVLFCNQEVSRMRTLVLAKSNWNKLLNLLQSFVNSPVIWVSERSSISSSCHAEIMDKSPMTLVRARFNFHKCARFERDAKWPEISVSDRPRKVIWVAVAKDARSPVTCVPHKCKFSNLAVLKVFKSPDTLVFDTSSHLNSMLKLFRSPYTFVPRKFNLSNFRNADRLCKSPNTEVSLIQIQFNSVFSFSSATSPVRLLPKRITCCKSTSSRILSSKEPWTGVGMSSCRTRQSFLGLTEPTGTKLVSQQISLWNQIENLMNYQVSTVSKDGLVNVDNVAAPYLSPPSLSWRPSEALLVNTDVPDVPLHLDLHLCHPSLSLKERILKLPETPAIQERQAVTSTENKSCWLMQHSLMHDFSASLQRRTLLYIYFKIKQTRENAMNKRNKYVLCTIRRCPPLTFSLHPFRKAWKN